MSEYVLKVEGVSKRLWRGAGPLQCEPRHQARRDPLPGRRNGSGKSTLIKLISGFTSPTRAPSKSTARSTKNHPHRGHHEGRAGHLPGPVRVSQPDGGGEHLLNYELYHKTRFINWKFVRKTAKEALERIKVDIPLHEKVENLSVADKQLIAISKAILHNARLIIMDEPTTALTRKEIDNLFTIIRRLQAEGIAILFVSHKLNEVFEIAENFTVLRNGKNVVTDSTAHVDHDTLVEYMTERRFAPNPFNPALEEGVAPLFEADRLCLARGFQDVSFQVRPGEILGITGLLGSGRTELAKTLFGLFRADSGSIRIAGKEVKINSPQDAIRNKIGYVPEDRLTEGLFLLQPIRENLVLANVDQLLTRHKTVDYQKIDEHMAYWRRELDILMSEPGAPISTLSGGNQQKVVLGKWLAIEPMVLILNGPTVGVDVGAKHDLHVYLRSLAQTGRIAIILISDDIPEVIENCNRILVMKKGRLSDEVRNTETTESDLLDIITR